MPKRRLQFGALLTLAFSASLIQAQIEFEGSPIHYESSDVDDPVARLQKKIDNGSATLAFDERRGYLDAVLEHLDIPASSQMLVFSKTSFQFRLISPRSPRALYFNDDVYVGWVRGADRLELSSVDPKQGTIFYTLPQRRTSRPTFRRETHDCLQCHGTRMTGGVPGNIVRSVYPAPDGQPQLRGGSYLTTDRSPFAERWGGWYVTGTHGDMRHLGNVVARSSDRPRDLDLDVGANVTSLAGRFDVDDYLTAHSDLVALSVHAHQTDVHNKITRAGFLTRLALHDGQALSDILERSENYISEATQRRINNATEPLVKALLFCGEKTLTDRIAGTTKFASEFASGGPFDRRGRSLRQLDLAYRLFEYPCSYLIYSAAFDQLPGEAKTRVYRRLWQVLSGADTSEGFAHLSRAERRTLVEILRDTKSDLPAYWHGDGKADAPQKSESAGGR